MEKQIILEEIKRISEIMNVKIKMNLFEQPQELSKFLEGGTKVGTRSMDEFIDKLSTSGLRQADLIANSFKELITKDVLSQTEKEFASQVIRDVFPYIGNEIESLLQNLKPGKLESVKKYFNDPKISVDKKIEKLKKWGYENANPLMVQVWTDEMNKMKREIVIPNPHVEPTPIDNSFDKLFDNLLNVNSAEESGSYIKNFIENEVNKGNLRVNNATIDEVVNDIIKSLNPNLTKLTSDLEKQFAGRTIAEQRLYATKIINNLEKSIPEEIKSKPWFNKWYSSWGSKVKTVGKSKIPYISAAIEYAKFIGGLYLVGVVTTGMYEFQKDDDGDSFMTKFGKSVKWMNTLFHYVMDDDNPTPTPSGQYTDTLDSFKQWLRDNNNPNAEIATHNETTGMYFIGQLPFEFVGEPEYFK